MPETPIVFDDVEMVTTSCLGHTFRIGGKDVFVGSAVPLKGTAAFIIGQVGRLEPAGQHAHEPETTSPLRLVACALAPQAIRTPRALIVGCVERTPIPWSAA